MTHDEGVEHTDFVWDVLSGLVETEEDAARLLTHIARIHGLFIAYFVELPVCEGRARRVRGGREVREGPVNRPMGNTEPADLARGLVWGGVGVAIFSLTLPATKVAVVDFSPAFVSMGRALVASGLAAGTLFVTRQAVPARSQLARLIVIAATIVIGFPLASAWAVARVAASHGASSLGCCRSPRPATQASGLASGPRRRSGQRAHAVQRPWSGT